MKEEEGKELKRVSTERVVSGPALKQAYQFFREKFPFLDKELPTEVTNSTHKILENALNKTDIICEMVL